MFNKIKSMFLKIKSQSTLKTYQKPLIITIFNLLIINVFVIFVASIIALTIDTDGRYFGGSFFKAIINVIKWMISVNSISAYNINEDLKILILAMFVVVIGMVLFSGVIIATLTTAVKAFIDKKSKAKGKIDISNHFVILNYNSKVPDIVYNLMCKGYKNNIVILSYKDKDSITTEIESVIANYNESNSKMKTNVIIKEGNPLLRSHLEDISIEQASTIVIMSREDMTQGDDKNISNSDLTSLKITLALGNFDINKDCNIVVETDTESTKDNIEKLASTINNLKTKSIIPVSFNEKIGQIIGQTVIQPLMANVYLDLLSFDGFEFYSYNETEIDDYLARYNNAIPIIKYDNLFVFAEDEKDIITKRERVYHTKRKLILNTKKEKKEFTIYVIGDNKKREFIIRNLNLAKFLYFSDFNIKEYSKDDNEKLIEDIKANDGNKKVLILSDDTVSSDSYDANVFVSLIAINTAFPDHDNIPLITELLDSRNLNSVKDFNIRNAIISNRIMSLLITQLALNKDSKRFYDGLLTVDTEDDGDVFNVNVSRVSELLDTEQNLTFKSKAELVNSFYYSFDKKCMLIGYSKDNNITYIAKNMDEKQTITLNPEDLLIYIKY